MFRILRNASPADGNGVPAENNVPAPANPQAAETVLNGTKTEREIALEGELQKIAAEKEQLAGDLEKEKQTTKEREVKIAELEDQAYRWRPLKF